MSQNDPMTETGRASAVNMPTIQRATVDPVASQIRSRSVIISLVGSKPEAPEDIHVASITSNAAIAVITEDIRAF